MRSVDKNGMRGGAAISAVALLAAFVADARVVVPVVCAALGIGSVFGLRYSPLGATYRAIKKGFNLRIPVEPEEPAPPRFAQTLGFVVTGLATVAFYALGNGAAGWTLALMVAALQGLLAATGICVGCEIYLFTRRFAAKGA